MYKKLQKLYMTPASCKDHPPSHRKTPRHKIKHTCEKLQYTFCAAEGALAKHSPTREGDQVQILDGSEPKAYRKVRSAFPSMYTPVINYDIPLADFTPTFTSLEERIDAAYSTLALLEVEQEGELHKADRDTAIKAFQTGRINEDDLTNPAVIIQTKHILDEYSVAVIESALQLRNFVTNKLVLLADNKDPRVQLKALEMIGKISDVGLFTDKTEITMRHRPTEELEQMLRERLTKVIEGSVFEPTVAHGQLDMDITDVTGPDAP